MRTTTNPTATHCRIHRAVTFARATRHELTLAAGSVVRVDPLLTDQALADPPDAPAPLGVEFAGRHAVIDMDDASPVEWDDADQHWADA